jgi:hypothetical protein
VLLRSLHARDRRYPEPSHRHPWNAKSICRMSL